MNTQLLQQKIAQAKDALRELDLDLWVLAGRETDEMPDPSFPLVVGTGVTWISLFLIGRNDHVAIVGTGDVENVRATGAWPEVVGYVQDFRDEFRLALERFQPRQIALNYSTDNVSTDGITHGVFLLLQEAVAGTPWAGTFVSAEPIVARVRGRKSPAEVALIREAIRQTEAIFNRLPAVLRPGMTEREISDYLHAQIKDAGLDGTAWTYEYCPVVDAGPDSPLGHVGPTDTGIQQGQLLHLDFGVKYQGYCSDLQRTWYFLRPGETDAPDEVKQAFQIVDSCIQEGAQALRPGVQGREVDAVAREIFAEHGLTWDFAFGHQMGRYCHDGGAVLGPAWPRYGQRPFDPVEVGHIYTLEIGTKVVGYGFCSLEEDVVVTEAGCEFLSTPQRELLLVQL